MGDISRSLEDKRKKEACPSRFPATGATSQDGSQQGESAAQTMASYSRSSSTSSGMSAPVAPGPPAADVMHFQQGQSSSEHRLLASAGGQWQFPGLWVISSLYSFTSPNFPLLALTALLTPFNEFLTLNSSLQEIPSFSWLDIDWWTNYMFEQDGALGPLVSQTGRKPDFIEWEETLNFTCSLLFCYFFQDFIFK